jgi:hypothetical protein
MTLAPLTDDHGAALLTWYLAAFPARTSAPQEKEPELPASDLGSGWKWRESSVKYDPAMRLWKTRQLSLLEDSEWFSGTWPSWGLMRDGECWELPMSARPTFARGSGLWPTIRSSDGERGGRGDLIQAIRGNPNSHYRMWPTPTKSDGTGGPGCGGRDGGLNLRTAVSEFATPQARDWKSGKASQATMDRNSRPLSEQIGGSLNPTWVEALMGWPRGWTQLEPLTLEVSDAFAKDFFGQAMPSLRDDVQPQSDAKWPTGGCSDIPASEVLLPLMCEQPPGSDARGFVVAGAEAQERSLRGLRVCKAPARSPLRPEPGEQQPGKPANTLRSLPRLLAHNGQEAWASGRWEDAIARVASGVPARVHRLRCLGNGQVPQCAALAFQLLSSGAMIFLSLGGGVQSSPEAWADVVQFDGQVRKATGTRGDSYLHRSCKPLDQVPLGEGQGGLDLEDDIYCAGGCGL